MAQQAKGIGQALGHFAMAFGHMMFGERPEGEEDEGENEGQEDQRARPSGGACCIKRGGSKVKKSPVRSVPRGNR